MSKVTKVELFALADGVLVLLPPDLPYATAVDEFDRLLRRQPDSFAGTAIVIDVANRPLTTTEVLALETLISRRLGVRVLQIVHYEADEVLADDGLYAEDRRRLADLGWQPGWQEPAPEPVPSAPAAPLAGTPVLPTDVKVPTEVKDPPRAAAPRPDGDATDQAAAKAQGGLLTVLLRRTIRSGQRVAFDGNIVVVGDVNAGAEIIAGGDVIVVGTLRGLAHAGAKGGQRAVVAALALQPTQLRIGSAVGRAPDQPTNVGGPTARLEVARLADGQIVVEEGLGRDAVWAGLSS